MSFTLSVRVCVRDWFLWCLPLLNVNCYIEMHGTHSVANANANVQCEWTLTCAIDTQTVVFLTDYPTLPGTFSKLRTSALLIIYLNKIRSVLDYLGRNIGDFINQIIGPVYFSRMLAACHINGYKRWQHARLLATNFGSMPETCFGLTWGGICQYTLSKVH